MTNKLKAILLNSSYIVWGIVLILGLMETFSYHGIVKKYTNFDLYLISAFPVLVLIVLKILAGVSTRFQVSVENLNAKIFTFLAISTVFFNVLERLTYNNFVFSKFHIQPQLLFFPFLISFVLYVFYGQNVFRRLLNRRFLYYVLFVVTVGYIFCYEFSLSYKFIKKDLLFMVKNPKATYDEKMASSVGAKFYYFTKFIKENTSEQATILIPPQGYPWPQSGNIPYIRYFLFPRNLVNGKEYEPGTEIKNVDYVLIDWGETEGTQYGYTHGWPKFDVDAEQIILWRTDGDKEIRNKTMYRYKNFVANEAWGLIKVNK